jgi:hypothetical protein
MSKKFELSFNVSDLPAFVNQNTDLMLEKINETTMLGIVEQVVDQQGSFPLNTLTNTIYVQLDACGFNPSGQTTAFGQDTVVLKNLKTDESLCAKDLRSKYVSQLYKIGADGSTLPFESFIVEGKSKLLAQTVEKLFWLGDTTGGVGNLAMVDGVKSFLDGKGSVYIAAATGVTVATAFDKVDLMCMSIPNDIINLSDLKLFVDPIIFRQYVSALKKAALYQGTAFQMTAYGNTMMIDGFNVEMIATNALLSTGSMYLTPASNLVFGTDLTSDTTNIKITYYERDETFDVKGRWAQGAGVYFPQFVVHNVSTISI